MSNLFKSKFFLGVMVAVVMLLGVVAFATPSEAASCSITTTLRVGSRGDEVKCLQSELGLTADGVFGPKTKAAVVAFQASKGLTADGIFGAKSRAAWEGSVMTPSGDLCPNGMTLASNCTMAPSMTPSNEPLCPNGMTLASNCSVAPSGTPAQSGPVSAMLATTNPAAGTLVAGQATANLAQFTFTGTGTVTGVTLKRSGVSADSTLSNVYLFDGATRLTDAASVSNNGMVTFTSPAGLFTVAGSKTITVKSDILTGTSGQTVGIMLTGFTTASGTVSVSLSGNIHTIATSTLAAVTLSGTVTPTGATLNPGSNVTVWQSTMSVSQRDVWMKRLALRQVGSAPSSSFQNFKLYVNGVQVSTAASLDSMGYVTFDLSSAPVLFVAGSRVVRVDADIISGASRTVHFSLRQAADVDFVDSSFNVNITPALTGTALPWTAAAASTISGTSGGSLTIEKDITSPSTNLVNGGTDVNIGTFKFTAFGEPIKVETLRVAYTGSANIADDDDSLRNGRVLINGVQYGSTASINETTDGTLAYTSFTVNYVFTPGTPVLVEVHADMYDDSGTNDIVAGTDTVLAVIATGSSNATRQDSLGSFNAPASAVSANTLTIAATTATLVKNSTYANQTTATPATGFKIGSWNLNGSSTEDILMTTLSFDVDEITNATFNEDDITNMYAVVKSGSTIVAQPSPLATLSAGGQDANFSINYTLVKNTNVVIELYGNLASGATALDSFNVDLTATGTALVSGTSVNASAGDIEGQTIIAGTASITVSKDASSPVTAIVYDNQTVTTLAAKFDAVTAGYNITDMTVTLGNANAATVVQSVMIYDGATLVASGPMTTTTTAVFNGLSINVPVNTSKVLTVKLQLGAVGVGAGTTGSTITTSIAAATDVVYTNTSTGVSTSTSAEEAGTATGSTMYVYAAIPTVNRVALPTTVLGSGTQVLAKFDVVSNGGTVAWKQVLFDITKSAAPTIATPTLWDVTNGANTQVTAAVVFQNGTGGVATTCVADNTVCELLISVGTNADDNVEEQVSGTKTYEVRSTIAGTLAAANSINVSIQSNLAHVSSAAYTGVDNDLSVDDASFVWSDISAQSHDTGTTDWVSENLLRVLPTSTWTMTFPN